MDNVAGTAGNDVIIGISNDSNDLTSTYAETFGGLDAVDGGAGNDTLVITNPTGTLNLDTSVSVKNVENLSLTSAQGNVNADVQAWAGLTNVTVDNRGQNAELTLLTKSNVTTVSVKGSDNDTFNQIVDMGSAATTADVLASVTLDAVGTSNADWTFISSDALTQLNLKNNTGSVQVVAASGARTLDITMNKQGGNNAGVRDDNATTVNVTATGAKSAGVWLQTDAAKTINFAGDKSISIGLIDSGVNASVVTEINSTNTAGVTITTTLGNTTAFTGGAGDDEIGISNANTKAIAMGAGDDTVNVFGTTLGAGGTIDGGDGDDMIAMSAADAAALSALTPATTYEARISNFEQVGLGQVAAFANNTVNLANLDDISYVVSAGTAAGTGSNEVATVTFSGLLAGQSITVGGETYTNNTGADLTAAQVAANFAAATELDDGDGGYAESVNGAVVTYTASVPGNLSNIVASANNSTAATLTAATTNNGSAAVTGVAEVATVAVNGLIAGEAVTVTSASGTRTVTATPIAEVATVTVGALADTQTLTVAGLTITSTGGHSAAQVQTVLAGGTVPGLAVTGSLTGYNAVTGPLGTVVFTSTTVGTNVTDLTLSGTGAGSSSVVVNTQGNVGNLTAAQVAAALASGTSSGAAVVTTSGGALGYTGSASGSTVTFTASIQGTTTDLSASSTAGTQPTVNVITQGVTAVAGVTETAAVTFTDLSSGQSVQVAGRTVTANGANLTAAQVEAAFLGGVNAGNAVVGGTLTGWTVAQDVGGANNGILTFTSTTANSNVTNIDAVAYGNSNATAPVAPVVSVVNGTTTAGGGNLTLTNMANDGTLELVGNNNGSTTVSMKDATGTADKLNLKLNGAANLAAGAVIVAGVENIAIVATDSVADTVTVNNPTAAATLALNAAAATSITLSGNHGVNFTGSSLAKVTTLDASGVVANVNTTGLTAAQIVAANGVAGAVTFTTAVTDKEVQITTGNGDDTIDASSVGTATGVTAAATISTGAGRDVIVGGADNDTIDAGSENDTVWSSTGADTITLGAGNDAYVLTTATHSVLAKYDTITDFSANTYGFGTSGAANSQGAKLNDATKVTGDVINLSAVIGGLNHVEVSGIDVLVVSNAADAQTFIQNTADAGSLTGIALDSNSNLLYIDLDSNGSIDSVIKLAGVTTIDEAAFYIGNIL